MRKILGLMKRARKTEKSESDDKQRQTYRERSLAGLHYLLSTGFEVAFNLFFSMLNMFRYQLNPFWLYVFSYK